MNVIYMDVRLVLREHNTQRHWSLRETPDRHTNMPLPTRKIGHHEVTAIGWGAMGLSIMYGTPNSDEERLKFLDGVYESGCNNWDTADCYGDSEDLLGQWYVAVLPQTVPDDILTLLLWL